MSSQRGFAKPRKTSKQVLPSFERNCHCRIIVQICEIYTLTPNNIHTNKQSTIAVISDNYTNSRNYGRSWRNRRLAPIPSQLYHKIESKVVDDPNLITFNVTIKRYMRNPKGLGQDMKTWWDLELDIKDPCFNIPDANRSKHQFHKASRELHKMHSKDQSRLLQYIQDLQKDAERHDPSDILHYSLYKPT